MRGTIHLVAGARPNFMKIAPLYRKLTDYPDIRTTIVHTGQHYDEKLSDIFFSELDLPHPQVTLEVGSGTHARQTGLVMTRYEQVVKREKPDIVVVVGDVNSTLACALVSSKTMYSDSNRSRPLLAHVEAGLRSFDMTMPEEINRLATDVLADLLFTTEPSGEKNLRREGIAPEKIHFVGNVMIDTLLAHREKARASRMLDELGLTALPYAVCTLHRPANVDQKEKLEEILTALREIGKAQPVILPLHPRTRKRIEQFGLEHQIKVETRIQQTDPAVPLTGLPPLGYLDFLQLMSNAKLVLTDSGGIQEETTILGVPCVTIRENTERPVTVETGTNVLAGTSYAEILASVEPALEKAAAKPDPPEKWDGQAAGRIANVLAAKLRSAT